MILQTEVFDSIWARVFPYMTYQSSICARGRLVSFFFDMLKIKSFDMIIHFFIVTILKCFSDRALNFFPATVSVIYS
jgi:hypothetical protein